MDFTSFNTGLNGLDTFIGLNAGIAFYENAKKEKDLNGMRNSLFAMHNILKNPNLEALLPNDLIVKFNLALNEIPSLLRDRANLEADTTLEPTKKEAKLAAIDKKIEKAEEVFKEMVQKNVAAFMSTLRTDLANANTKNKGTNKKAADEVIAKLNNLSTNVLPLNVKDVIKREIDRLKTEELTIMGEKEGDLEKEDNISSYNLEKAVNTVNGVDKNDKHYSAQYSKTMMVKAITHRLQQINKELVDIRAKKLGDGTYERADAERLQALITEQAQLTKKLMNLKRNLLQVVNDKRLVDTNKGIKMTQTLLDSKILNHNNAVSQFAQQLLRKHLVTLQAKQGRLVAKQKLDVLYKVDKMAKKAEDKGAKKAYRSVKARYIVDGRINQSRFKTAIMVAVPTRIGNLTELKSQEFLYEEAGRTK